MTVSFPAGAFKNADTKLADGTTTPGASNTAFALTFTVQGGTARLVDPGAGGSIDVNVLNDRDWIDVQFVAPTGLKIDAGSITDLDPGVHAHRPRRRLDRARRDARAVACCSAIPACRRRRSPTATG